MECLKSTPGALVSKTLTLLVKLRVCYVMQNESTGQNNTWQYKAEQHMTNIYDIKQILSCMIFDGKNVILVI